MQLKKSMFTAKDFYESISKLKPPVGDSDLEKQIKFIEEFGMKGWICYVIMIMCLYNIYKFILKNAIYWIFYFTLLWLLIDMNKLK